MKVNYMKMIMAKGVFKMRAAQAWMCMRTCVCVCVSCLGMKVVHSKALHPRPALLTTPPTPLTPSSHQW